MKDKTLSNEEILKRAISKAVKNGWKYKIAGFNYMSESLLANPYQAQGFIFSHDFAKAFWKDKPLSLTWLAHLQTMVSFENPVKYLEQFI